jgi:predicted Zn-dependent protease
VILARIVQARPDHLLARVNLGRALLTVGRAAEARDCLARAVAMAPHDQLVRESHAAAAQAARR